ncbi:hypothetical protein MASR2M15_17480 [Anaerolineales bacterium]
MVDKRIRSIILGALSILTLSIIAVSFISISAETPNQQDSLILILISVMTCYTIYFSVPLTQTEIHLVSVIGMVAFLSFGDRLVASLTLAIFIGSLFGAALSLVGWRKRLGLTEGTFTTRLITISAGVTLSFFVSSQLYLWIQAPVPLSAINLPLSSLTLYLLIYSAIYVTVYMCIHLLQVYLSRGSIDHLIQDDWRAYLIVLLLPIPFAITAAYVIGQSFSEFFLIISIIGLIIIIQGLHQLSRSKQLLTNQLEELRNLARSTQYISNYLNVSDVYDAVFRQITHTMRVDNVSIAIADSFTDHIKYPLIVEGEKRREQLEPYDQALLTHVLQSGKALILLDNVQTQARTLEIKIDTRYAAWIGVPLQTAQQIIGALAISIESPHKQLRYTDYQLLTIIGTNVAVTIQNAKLYTQKSQQTKQLSILNQTSSQLSQTLILEEVASTILLAITTLIDAQAVALYVNYSGDLRLIASHRLDILKQSPHPDALSWNPAEPIQTYNAHMPSLSDSQYYLAQHLTDWIELDLIRANLLVGRILIVADQHPLLDASNQDLLIALGTQAANAIYNARRYEETDRALERHLEQLQALATLGSRLNASLPPADIFRIALQLAMQATYSSQGAILERHTQGIDVKEYFGYQPNELDLLALVNLPQSHGEIRINQAIYPRQLHKIKQIQSLLITIRTDRTDHGLLLESQQREYTDEDISFLSQVANHVVTALQSYHYVMEMEKAYRQVEIILHSIAEGIILIDERRKIVMVNSRIDLLNLAPHEILHQSLDDLLADPELKISRRLGFASDQALSEHVNFLLNGHFIESKALNFDVYYEGGIRHIQREIIPLALVFPGATGIMLVYYNVTQETELTNARQSFSEMMIHDLRSPLMAVTTGLRLLEKLSKSIDLKMQAMIIETVETSDDAIQKILSRIDSLLDISKMESQEMILERNAVKVNKLVDAACKVMEPLAGDKQVTLVPELNPNLPVVYADEDKVERLIINLIDNAINYSPQQSNIYIRASCLEDTDWLKVEVVDHGPGIPDEFKEKIFSRFVQIQGRKRIRHGVGLGLAFCHMVTEAHGGKIWIEDNPSGGSIFVFTLPLTSQLND